MKFLIKTIKEKKITITIVLFVYVIFGSHIANAADGQGGASIISMFGNTLAGLVYQSLANFFTILQTIAGYFIMFAGVLLNYSINLTLHIKEFVDQTPAILTTWKALRDISGIFIIFFLLYEAIQLITGLKSPKFSAILKDIVLAGILINFSFFFASLGIDVSNIVSVQLYNSIAPASSLNADYLSPDKVDKIAKSGGISDIFMQSMKMPKFFDTANPTEQQSSTKGSNFFVMFLRIILTGVVSVVIMITAAFSFILASAMFIVRFIMLLFLLAFSPVWFMSFIAPQLEPYTKDWKDYYKSMLLIMPVYLLLMYMSLNVLSTTKFFGNPETQKTTTSTTQANSGMVDKAFAAENTDGTSSTWSDQLLSLAVNAVLVIFMMNIPLVGALSIGGKLTSWIPGTKALSAGNVWKKVGAFSGRNTLGRGAAAFSQSSVARSLYAKNPMLGSALNKSLGKVSSAGFGDGKDASHDAVRKAHIKDMADIAKKSNFTEEETNARVSNWVNSDSAMIDLKNQHSQSKNELESLIKERDRVAQRAMDETDPVMQKEYEKELAAINNRIEKQIPEEMGNLEKEMKTKTESERDRISKSRQNDIADNILKQSFSKKIVSKVTKGKLGKAPDSQSVERAIADEIRKGKSKGDKLYEEIMKQAKEEIAKSSESKPKDDSSKKT